MAQPSVVSVSQLNRYVKALLTENQLLSGLMVRGEISNFTRHYKSGHLYFTLKDEAAAIKAVMFRSYAEQVRFNPENGMGIIVSGAVSLYERDGSYQFYVTDMQPDGIGALHLAFEQLRDKLLREGLFDEQRKRPIPAYPETIGIVTSEGAAALQDMLSILERRYPAAHVLLCPAQVQGQGAAQTIIHAIRQLNASRACDVIIVGRGGGSIEDLWAFNDESLARTIAGSEIPIISGVGHETDFTIADFAADLRAPTPSAAVELATPNLSDVRYYLDDLADRCLAAAAGKIERMQQQLQALRTQIPTPRGVLENYEQRLSALCQALDMQIHTKLGETETRLRYLAELADGRSPLRLLERGYSLTASGEKTVKSVDDVKTGSLLVTRLRDGEITSQVSSTTKKSEWSKRIV